MAKPNIFYVVALVLMAVAAWMVYGRALDAPFIYDDAASVNTNGSITELWPLIGAAEHPGPLNPPDEMTTSGRPLVNLSLAVNYHFGKLNPFGYHLFNLIVHVLSAWLLMAIVRRTLCLDYFAGRFDRVSGGLAFAAAVLWMVHPLQTETVVYVTQRTELMVGFFYLATLYVSLRYWAATTSAARTAWAALATMACLAGMACKEVMVTAPVVVLLFERTLVTGTLRRAVRQSWPLYLGLAWGWVLLFWLNHTGPRSTTAGFDLGVPVLAWWLTQSKVLWTYLKLSVWPWPLSIRYESSLLTLGAAWPWVVSTILLAAATLVLLWRRNAVGLASAWVLIILSPTLVVPIVTEFVAERRMYLPLAALATLVVVGGFWLAQQALARWRRVETQRQSGGAWPEVLAAAGGLLLAVALSLVSVHRLEAYQDELKLWQDDVIHQPEDPIAHYNLGEELGRRGQMSEAIDHYLKALRLKPDYPDAHNNLGQAYASAGRLQDAIDHYQQALRLKPESAALHFNLGCALDSAGRLPEAIEEFQHAVQLKRDFPEALINLGNALEKSGKTPEAIQQYQQAIKLKPDYAEAHSNLGIVLAAVGRLPEAIEQDQRALQLDANLPEAEYNLAKALANVGRVNEAIDHYRQALKRQPDHVAVLNDFGNALVKTGRTAEAIEAYRQALRLNPNYVDAYNGLGAALLASGRPQDAVEQYQQALRLKPDYAEINNNLTAAYVQLKRPNDAIAAAERGIALARAQGQTGLAEQLETWLKSYRAAQAKSANGASAQ